MMPLSLLLGAVAAHAIVVSGPSQCPTAETVQRLLAQQLPVQTSADCVYLEQADGALTLELRSAITGTVSRRQLPDRRSCQQQAAIAATVIAAWLIDSQGATAEPPPAPPTPILPPPAPPEVVSRTVLRYELAGAIGTFGVRDSYTIGGLVDALLLPGRRSIGLRIGALGSALRSVPLSTGAARWTRAGLRLSGGYRFLPESSGGFSIDCFADTAIAIVYVAGQGFDHVYASTDADFGFGGSVRIGRQLGPVRVFWELAFTRWLRPQAVTAQGALVRATLPQVEGLLSVGIAALGAQTRRFFRDLER